MARRKLEFVFAAGVPLALLAGQRESGVCRDTAQGDDKGLYG